MLSYSSTLHRVRGYRAAAVGLAVVVGGAFTAGAAHHSPAGTSAPRVSRTRTTHAVPRHRSRVRAHHRPAPALPSRPATHAPRPAQHATSGSGVSGGSTGPSQSTSHSS